jgi:hypothetical protein
LALIVLNAAVPSFDQKGTSPHRIDRQFTLTRLRVKSHDRLEALGSNVVGGLEIRIVKDIRIVRLHPIRDALLVSPSAVSATHGMIMRPELSLSTS